MTHPLACLAVKSVHPALTSRAKAYWENPTNYQLASLDEVKEISAFVTANRGQILDGKVQWPDTELYKTVHFFVLGGNNWRQAMQEYVSDNPAEAEKLFTLRYKESRVFAELTQEEAIKLAWSTTRWDV